MLRANRPTERAELENRYQEALAQSANRTTLATVQAFEALMKTTIAVITCRLQDVETLLTSDSELFTTYYRLVGVTFLPKGDDWDKWRQTAKVNLFGIQNVGEIRFAALSADGNGLTNYKGGDCFVHLREDMIGHRATVFEENNVLFWRMRAKVDGADYPPAGHMAIWEERHKLCVAKLHGRITNETVNPTFAEILLKNGATTAEDEFVEVHIFGPMTRRSLSKIIVVSSKTRTKTALKKLRDLAKAANIPMEIKS